VLTVHRSSSGLALVAGLAELLADVPADPFTPEVVAVPAPGIERWLAQRLSHRLGAGEGDDGVCANVLFPRPAQVLDAAVSAVSPEHARAVEEWDPEQTVWTLVDLLEEVAASLVPSPGFELVHRHLQQGSEVPTGRRYVLARRVAALLHRYEVSRPELLRDWAAGRVEVPDDLRWQPLLWQQLRDRLGPGPAELLDDARAGLVADPAAVDLPARISVYGASRVDASRLQVLAALAEHRDVHLWVHHASPVLWDAIAAAGAPADLRRRRTASPARTPLLASLSRDVQELQRRLAVAAPGHAVVHHAPAARPSTLLGVLQSSLHDDALPAPPHVLDPADRSVQVHSCHGRARQVEVLRDVVLGLLADDPTLQPRDVVVMCPDVESFAPLVTAAFGAEPAAGLRVRLADRSPRQVNPVLGAVGTVLDLVAGRVTASEVLSLAGAPPVRRRFRLDDDDLEQVHAWVVGSRAHWGLDGSHRAGWRMGHVSEGTWRAAVDRVLAGVALGGSDRAVGGAFPLDGIDSGDVDLAGRFAELVDRIDHAVTELGREMPVDRWLDAVELVTTSLVDVPADDAWQVVQLREELAAIRRQAAASSSPLTLADVRAMLEARLAGRPTRASFRTGGITVCTLVPMRSVPHRVVCLLGMDDDAFPRRSRPDGDDLLARDPHLGERDPRSEDRQLFLDALTAAQEHLVVVYRGAHERTGAPLPAAVPVGELLDAVDAVAQLPDGAKPSTRVVVRHPLQPTDPRNFAPGALGRPAPSSFDRPALAGARATLGPRVEPVAVVPEALPPAPADADVALADLRSFLVNPVRGFLAQRLQVADPWEDEPASDAIEVDLGGLGEWGVGARALDALQAGHDIAAIVEAERGRGTLPPEPLATEVLRKVGPEVENLYARAGEWLHDGERRVPAEAVEVEVALADGRRLTGSVSGLRGSTLLRLQYSKLAPKHRLEAWLDLLALAASSPGTATQAVVLGRGGRGSSGLSRLRAPEPDEARAMLLELVRLRDLGLRLPLPLPIKTCAAYAGARFRKGSMKQATYLAGQEWTTGYTDREKGFSKEDAATEHLRVWGERYTFEQLVGWESPERLAPFAEEESDLGRLSCTLWWPLLEHEETR
jgi:exodeoxyribonuclease V gamma subunit